MQCRHSAWVCCINPCAALICVQRGEALRLCMEGMRTGEVVPLPYTIFPWQKAGDAFAFLSKGHKPYPPPCSAHDKAYPATIIRGAVRNIPKPVLPSRTCPKLLQRLRQAILSLQAHIRRTLLGACMQGLLCARQTCFTCYWCQQGVSVIMQARTSARYSSK